MVSVEATFTRDRCQADVEGAVALENEVLRDSPASIRHAGNLWRPSLSDE
jgi:hypothetical protein